MNVLEVSQLRRDFGARRALDGVNLDVPAGGIVGLVGPNGSGKTTLLEIAAGLLAPTAGRVRVLGHDPYRERALVMRGARFAFAPPALFESLSPREHLRALTSLAPGRTRVSRSEQEAALALVGLADRGDDPVGTFSFGLRQRVALAQALLPEPRLLVLDEPTDGLDPLAVLELRALLSSLRERGVAILLSSHLLVEVDELVDSLVVLVDGRVAYAGTPGELRAGGERLVLTTSDDARARRVLAEHGFADSDGGAGTGPLALPAGSLELRTALELLAQAGIELCSFALERPSLEQALLTHLRGHRP